MLDRESRIVYERECSIQKLDNGKKEIVDVNSSIQKNKLIITENDIVFETEEGIFSFAFEDLIERNGSIEIKLFGTPRWWTDTFVFKKEYENTITILSCVFYGNFAKERESVKMKSDYINQKICDIRTNGTIVAEATGRDYKFTLYEDSICIERLNETILPPKRYPLHNLKNISEIKALPMGEVKVNISWLTGDSITYFCSRNGDFQNFVLLIETLINKVKETSLVAIYYGGHPGLSCDGEKVFVKLKKDRIILCPQNSKYGQVINYVDIENVRYESKQEISERVTATRMALLGVYAFAFKKKETHNQKYLSIETNKKDSVRDSMTIVLSGNNVDELYYRLSNFCDEYKKELNNNPQCMEVVNENKDNDYVQELKQLKELFDMGIISEEEFNLKKKQILKI